MKKQQILQENKNKKIMRIWFLPYNQFVIYLLYLVYYLKWILILLQEDIKKKQFEILNAINIWVIII